VLVEGEAVAEATSSESDGIEEVLVNAVAIAEGFAGVEEEGDAEAFFGAALLEPEEEKGEGGEGAAEVFLADEVVAAD
jgi:hypothetical protein